MDVKVFFTLMAQFPHLVRHSGGGYMLSFRFFVIIQIIVSLIFSSQVFSYQLHLNRSITVRKENPNSSVLAAQGYIGKGTLVEIPNMDLEEENVEKALMKWLRKSGSLHKFSSRSGTKRDYFFPVKIKKVKYSKGVEVDQTVMIPIRYLIRQNGLSLRITEDAPYVLEEKMYKISRLLGKTRRRIRNRTRSNLSNRKTSSYKKHCPGSFEELRTHIRDAGQRHQIPPELLLSIIQMETSGGCFEVRNEQDGSKSVGLFQVNTKTSSIPVCNQWQLIDLRNSKNFTDLKRFGLYCLQNPVTNLEEAARILREKYSLVNSQRQPSELTWLETDQKVRDAWRKALAAYNGGQGYVYQSYNDVLSFNRKQGTNLDPNDWEDRRLFFFRRFIDRTEDKKLFDKRMRHTRSYSKSLINLAYVESIAGRETLPVLNQVSFVARWITNLYANIFNERNKGTI